MQNILRKYGEKENMGEERGVSMDILPVGMTEEFTEFLENMQNRMTELVADSDQLARKLDNKDDNTENQDFARLCKTMAESANKIIGVVRDAVETAIEKLEEKNKDVGSSYQDKCIVEIENCKDSLFEQEYTDCQLNGEDPAVFTTEEKAAVQSDMEELMNKWNEYNNELCEQAEALSNYKEKNELSDVCFEIADQIQAVATGCIDAMEAAGEHMETVDSQREANTDMINENAQANMEAVNQEMTNILKDIESALEI